MFKTSDAQNSDGDGVENLPIRNQKQNEEATSSSLRSSLLKKPDALHNPPTYQSQDKNYLCDFDIGTISMQFLDSATAAQIISRGHQKMPNEFPRDGDGKPFYVSLLKRVLPNGETVERDWLVWSREKSAFFLFAMSFVQYKYP